MSTYTVDKDGFEWADNVPSARQEKLNNDFVSMPFSGMSSPIEKGNVLPLIVHKAGATGAINRRTDVEGQYQSFVDSQLKQWGETSPHTIDWQALNAAHALLLEGVIEGDAAKVKTALQNHADPNMLVSVRDPNAEASDPFASYVNMPIGVAAVLRGRELAVASGNKLAAAPFKEVAAMLLMDGNTPRISVGNSPDGNGSAIGYTAFGVKLYGNDAGADSVENRVVNVPMSVRNAVSAAAPMCMVDDKVPAATNGVVWGEDLPKDARNNYMDMIDTKQSSLSDSLERYRLRRAGVGQPSGMKMK